MVITFEILNWYAKKDNTIWDKLIGCQIRHINSEYGLCIIEDFIEGRFIIKTENNNKFTTPVDRIIDFYRELIIQNNREGLENLLSNLLIKKEKDELLESIMNEYGVPIDLKLKDKIYQVMSKIANAEILHKDDEKILFNHKLFKALAKYHEGLIKKDKWSIPKAGKYWRYAQNPERSIELTEIEVNNNNNLNSAIQTNRGAAFLDLGLHEESKRCAEKAIEYNNAGCCPFNLLGSIYLDLGDIDEADNYFSIAKSKKGFNDNAQKNEIREIIRKIRLRNDVEKERLIVKKYTKYISDTNRIDYEYDDIPF
jgi:tetratricopeptide (TPR) repeat protein